MLYSFELCGVKLHDGEFLQLFSMALLKLIEGENPFCYKLPDGETVIGRHPNCDLKLSSKTVSSIHAKIVKRNQSFYVEDLGSRNGTWVNNRSIHEPVKLKDNHHISLGEIVLRFKDDSPFNIEFTSGKQDATMITSIAPSAGNAGLYETHPEAKLKAIVEISSSLAGTMDLHALLPKMLDTLLHIFPHADRACMLLKDESTGEMVSRAIKNRLHNPRDCVRLSRTIVNKVLTEKNGILSADASTDSQFEESQTIADLSIRSMMCVPMPGLDGEPLGIINVDSQQPGACFTHDDLELLMAVAGQAALSYENARLLDSYIEKQRQDNELAIARNVQRSLLPKVFPDVRNYDFYASYDSALAVGGDYYDCFVFGDDTVCLALGDVAGKGVPSALIMTWLSSCVQTTLRFVHEAGRAAIAINEQMCSRIVEGRFVTFILMIIDLKTNELSIVNAGHMAPIIRKLDGSIDPLDDANIGPPFGVLKDHEYRVEKRIFEPGDTIAIVTDGIYEARNTEGEFYGMERVFECVRQSGLNAHTLSKALLEDVLQHLKGRQHSDDITIMSIGRAY